MCVVDHDIDAVGAQTLHSARNACQAPESTGARRIRDAQQPRDGDRRCRIPNVETPRDLQFETFSVNRKASSLRFDDDIAWCDHGSHARAVRNHPAPLGT